MKNQTTATMPICTNKTNTALSQASKCPWALTAQNLTVSDYTEKVIKRFNYPRARAHPRCKVSCHRRFVRVSSRPAQQWRKLHRATKRTTCSLIAKFPQCLVVTCSTQISSCRGRMLWTRPMTGVCKPLMPAPKRIRTIAAMWAQRTYLQIHYTKILHGRRLHREPWKTTGLSKLGGGHLGGYRRLPGTIW